MNADTSAQGLAATADVDRVAVAGFYRYRATLRGRGGSASIGYGDTEVEARADLAATIAFNLAHNGRAIA